MLDHALVDQMTGFLRSDVGRQDKITHLIPLTIGKSLVQTDLGFGVGKNTAIIDQRLDAG